MRTATPALPVIGKRSGVAVMSASWFLSPGLQTTSGG